MLSSVNSKDHITCHHQGPSKDMGNWNELIVDCPLRAPMISRPHASPRTVTVRQSLGTMTTINLYNYVRVIRTWYNVGCIENKFALQRLYVKVNTWNAIVVIYQKQRSPLDWPLIGVSNIHVKDESSKTSFFCILR